MAGYQGVVMIIKDDSLHRRSHGLAWIVACLVVLGLGITGCGPRRLNVVQTTQQTMVTVGYSADRSNSIFRADNEAQEYCERKRREVVLLNEETIYQGRYSEDVTQTARTAGRIAGALGSPRGAATGRALSSPTDYKTTLEFVCR